MRCIPYLLSILLAIGLIFPDGAVAQRGQRGMNAPSDSMRGARMGGMGGPMMGRGMMHMMGRMGRRMMRNPMQQSRMTVYMLPALADTLELTATQARTLEELKSRLMSTQQEVREKISAEREEMRSRFEEDDDPAPDAFREHLRTTADLHVRLRASTYETGQEMRQVLTSEQRAMVDAMAPQERMQLMMSRLSMRDMMRMMNAGGSMGGGMGADCPMTGMQRMRMRPGMGRQMMQQRGRSQGQ